MLRRWPDLPLAAAAAVVIAASLWQLERATRGLEIREAQVGETPVTMFRSANGGPAPAVVIAHGFAGSRQIMQPFAVTLARNGYLAVTFDFPGHGANPTPMAGDIADYEANTRTLVADLGAVVEFARSLPGSDGRLALLGHSMASDAVARYAVEHPQVAATVGVSMFSPQVTADAPRNLLVIDGALEPSMLHEEARRVVGMVTDTQVQEDVTYGSFQSGTARRLVLADGVEHIGVLYSGESMRAALDWLNQVFERSSSGFVDARAPWLGLLFLGLVVLARPASRLLPPVAPIPTGSGLGWRHVLKVSVAATVLTPLILWPVPSDFLPLLLGDYVALHFALFGIITAIGIWRARGRWARLSSPSGFGLYFAVATVAVAAYSLLAIMVPTDRYLTAFLPAPWRLPLIAALFAGTLAFFLADEWLTRGEGAPRGAYAATKMLFLVSLVVAVTLNLEKLFFLVIIIPAILALFVVYGLFSGWSYRRTGHPWVAAIANALAFAWAMAVTFPIVA